MKRQSFHVKDGVTYDQFTKQQVIWTHGYGATDRYVTRNEWGALLLQWPVHTWSYNKSWKFRTFLSTTVVLTWLQIYCKSRKNKRGVQTLPPRRAWHIHKKLKLKKKNDIILRNTILKHIYYYHFDEK